MLYAPDLPVTAFVGTEVIATGTLIDVATKCRELLDAETPVREILIYSDTNSHPVELDLSGDVDEVRARILVGSYKKTEPEDKKTRAGRPKLGVIGKEVTLLPRQWDWLKMQRGGASVTLRKLVAEAMKAAGPEADHQIRKQAVYHMMVSIGGNLPNFEEAIRCLYADDQEGFIKMIDAWPVGLRDYLVRISEEAFSR